MESRCRTFRREDGVLGVGFIRDFANGPHACISWPDAEAGKYHARDLWDKWRIEDVTDQLPQLATTIESRKVDTGVGAAQESESQQTEPNSADSPTVADEQTEKTPSVE